MLSFNEAAVLLLLLVPLVRSSEEKWHLRNQTTLGRRRTAQRDVRETVLFNQDSANGKGSSSTTICVEEVCNVNCDALTECDWPGFNPSYLGDGFCDTSGCYNHKICGFDGGDCE